LRHIPTPFCFSYFGDRAMHSFPGWPELGFFYLCFLCSWDDRCVYHHTCHLRLRWHFMNFLLRLLFNLHLPYLCRLSSEDYRHEQPHLAPWWLVLIVKLNWIEKHLRD
jgi:hypothetical protein